LALVDVAAGLVVLKAPGEGSTGSRIRNVRVRLARRIVAADHDTRPCGVLVAVAARELQPIGVQVVVHLVEWPVLRVPLVQEDRCLVGIAIPRVRTIRYDVEALAPDRVHLHAVALPHSTVPPEVEYLEVQANKRGQQASRAEPVLDSTSHADERVRKAVGEDSSIRTFLFDGSDDVINVAAMALSAPDRGVRLADPPNRDRVGVLRDVLADLVAVVHALFLVSLAEKALDLVAAEHADEGGQLLFLVEAEVDVVVLPPRFRRALEAPAHVVDTVVGDVNVARRPFWPHVARPGSHDPTLAL